MFHWFPFGKGKAARRSRNVKLLKADAMLADVGLERRRSIVDRALGPNRKPAAKVVRLDNVADWLVENKFIEPSQARAARLEARARGATVATILQEQGAVPRDQVIRATEAVDVNILANSLEYDLRVHRHVLLANRICVHAVTDARVMLSSTAYFPLVKQLMQLYVGDREIVEVPFSYDRWAEFEQNIDRIMEPGQELVGWKGEDKNIPSIIGDDVEDAQVLDILIDVAALMESSDIHIEPSNDVYNVFFRRLGEREMMYSGRFEQYEPLLAMVKERARVDVVNSRLPQDGSFKAMVRGRGFDIRVATLPTYGYEKATLRLLDPLKGQKSLSSLGIHEVDLWRHIVNHRHGLVLIVGATGSGKTTTLNATIREMDRIALSVYTAEDPVEYRIENVTQVQINPAAGLDYPQALKAFMRSDPDVIVLGEIRDRLTAENVVQAAQTGHLVIGTIHAETVPMALDRLIGLGVSRENLEMLLRGVLVQSLIRTLCPVCNGAKCPECFEIGYAGRTVVSEIAVTSGPRDVARIMSGDPEQHYWRPLWKDLESKLQAGVTDGNEIYRCFASELEEMKNHSEILAGVLAEAKANRHRVGANVSAARTEGLEPGEKAMERRLLNAKLLAKGIREDHGDDVGGGGDAEPSGELVAAG